MRKIMDKKWYVVPVQPSSKDATPRSIKLFSQTIMAPYKVVPLGCALIILALVVLVIGVQVICVGSREVNKSGQTPSVLVVSPAQHLSLGHVQTVVVHVYPFQQAGLISPVVDSKGMIWCSEINANTLARLDPSTGQITEWVIKSKKKTLTTLAIGAHDTIWFVEQGDNVLGHFDPRTRQFTWYPLQPFNGHSSSPQGLFFDHTGMLWFTEMGAQQLGRLNPETGKIDTWSLPKTTHEIYPYSLTSSPDGALWIGMLGGAIVRFDPISQHFSLFPLFNAQADVTSIVADQREHIWFNELPSQTFGQINIVSGRISEFQLPLIDQDSSTISGISNLVFAADGTIWLANPGSHLLVHYLPNYGTIHAYQPSPSSSEPFELIVRPDGGLWFTASSRSGSYIGAIDSV